MGSRMSKTTRAFREVNLTKIQNFLENPGNISGEKFPWYCRDILSRKSVSPAKKEKALRILLVHGLVVTSSIANIFSKSGLGSVCASIIAEAEIESGLEIKSEDIDPGVAKALMLRGVPVTSVHAFSRLVRAYTSLEDILFLVRCASLGDWTYREYDERYSESRRKAGMIPCVEPMMQFVVSDMLWLTRETLVSGQRIGLVQAAIQQGAVCDAPLDNHEDHPNDRKTPINIAVRLLDGDLFRFLHENGVDIDSGANSFNQYESVPNELNHHPWKKGAIDDSWNILQYYFTNTMKMKQALDALFDPFAKRNGEHSLFRKLSDQQKERLISICMERGSTEELEHLARLLVLRDQADLLMTLDLSGKIQVRTIEHLRQAIKLDAHSVEQWLLKSGVGL